MLILIFISSSVVFASNLEDGNITDVDIQISADSDDLEANSYKLAKDDNSQNMDKSSYEIIKTSQDTLNPSSIKINKTTVFALSNVTFNVSVVDNNTMDNAQEGFVVYKINNLTIGQSNVSNGKTSYTYDISKLSSKNYTLDVLYSGSNTLLKSSTTTTLKIIQRPTSMSVKNITVYSYTTANLLSTVVDKANKSYIDGGKVAFKLNGITIGYGDIINGKAHLDYDVSSLSPKNYTLTVVYSGTKDAGSQIADGILSIIKRESAMTVSDKKIYYGQNVTLVATVADKVDHSYVSNGTVVFKINGKTVANVNITNGKAYYDYDSSKITAKQLNISTVYSGTKYLSENRANGTLTIMLRPVTLNTTAQKVYKFINTPLYVTVKDKQTNNSVTDLNVLFMINNTKIGQSTLKNSNANITFDTSKYKEGTYNISIKLMGEDKYESTSINTTLTILEQKSFNYTEIKNAAITVRNNYEANKIIKEVKIGSQTIEVQDLLALMIRLTQNISKKKGTALIKHVHYDMPDSQYDNITKGRLYYSEIMKIGENVLNYMETNNVAPRYAQTSQGCLGFYNIIYSYTKIVDVSTSNYLVETTLVYNWNTIHPTNPKVRHIYISTDNIYTKTKDAEFVNQIIAKLKQKGYNATAIGIGPNTHNTKIWSGSLPDNAVQLSIFGGSDAGVFNDIITRSFMRTKANRLLFIALNPKTAKNITNLTWLERAHDDNYSPAAFKGMYYPDKQLLSHGYDYVYSYDVDEIVNSLIEYIS